jgi:hypothetical protein
MRDNLLYADVPYLLIRRRLKRFELTEGRSNAALLYLCNKTRNESIKERYQYMSVDELMREILASTKIIAVIGASDKPHRASYGVMQFLQSKGFRCIPVSPRLAGKTLLGETVYARLADIPYLLIRMRLKRFELTEGRSNAALLYLCKLFM